MGRAALHAKTKILAGIFAVVVATTAGLVVWTMQQPEQPKATFIVPALMGQAA